MDAFTLILNAWLLSMSMAMFAVSLIGLRREKNPLLLAPVVISLAFFIKSAFFFAGIVWTAPYDIWKRTWFSPVFDSMIILFIFLYIWNVPKKERELSENASKNTSPRSNTDTLVIGGEEETARETKLDTASEVPKAHEAPEPPPGTDQKDGE